MNIKTIQKQQKRKLQKLRHKQQKKVKFLNAKIKRTITN